MRSEYATELMDFQSMNLLNVWLNLISGNLLPMTANNTSFSIFWKIYSIIVWLLELFQMITCIISCFFVPIEKVLNDGILSMVVTVEGIFMVARIQAQRKLVRQLIRKLNDILRVEDETMRNIVMMNLKPMKIPFRLYLIVGTLSVTTFYCTSLPLIFEKSTFFYVDYRQPVMYSKEPFSIGFFLLGSIISLISNVYIFFKKVSVDVYTTYLVSLITSQYQYISFKLVSVFRDNSPQNNHNNFREAHFSETNFAVEEQIKTLCRHHISALQITSMLKKVLALNFSLTYVNSVLRFCFLGIMITKISGSFLEGLMVLMYGSVAIVQFYILCLSVHRLIEASKEVTDKAFHEDWNQYGISIKRIFILVIMASNNLELKLSTFEKFNLSLPSFMAVLNQSYSFALLILKVN